MGIGAGLVDYMVKRQTLEDGDIYPPFGVYGGTFSDAEQEFKKYRTEDTEDDAMYIIKANAPFDTAAYTILQTQILSGKVKFLIEQRAAKAKLLSRKMGQCMTPEERNDYLMPFTFTDILRTEMLNLREEDEGINIRLKPANRNIGHDKFSSLLYGIYYIREIEDAKLRRKHSNFSQYMFIG